MKNGALCGRFWSGGGITYRHLTAKDCRDSSGSISFPGQKCEHHRVEYSLGHISPKPTNYTLVYSMYAQNSQSDFYSCQIRTQTDSGSVSSS